MLQTASAHAESQRAGGRRGAAGRGGEEWEGGFAEGFNVGARHHGQTLLQNKLKVLPRKHRMCC